MMNFVIVFGFCWLLINALATNAAAYPTGALVLAFIIAVGSCLAANLMDWLGRSGR